MRLDKYLVEKLNIKSRTYAENLVLKGKVSVDGKVVKKPSADVDDDNVVALNGDDNYASQGAYKLVGAIESFSLDLKDKDCADVGCSNGGFTDVLLRNGVHSVLAVDVAECALSEEILQDERVTFLRQNAREKINAEPCDFVCSDVSFISQKLILPTIYSLLKIDGKAVVLIKPQFELDKSRLNKKGIVTDENDRMKAVELVKGYAVSCGFTILGVAVSPIFYDSKNVEYLLHVKK